MKNLKGIFMSFLILSFVSCGTGFCKSPYVIRGEMIIDDNNHSDLSVFEYSFKNLTSKTVSSFTVVFYLFDESGNSVLTGKPCITKQIDEVVYSDEICESFFSLDPYISVVPDSPYSVDYLYVSRITYTDGTIWTDPFGMNMN